MTTVKPKTSIYSEEEIKAGRIRWFSEVTNIYLTMRNMSLREGDPFDEVIYSDIKYRALLEKASKNELLEISALEELSSISRLIIRNLTSNNDSVVVRSRYAKIEKDAPK